MHDSSSSEYSLSSNDNFTNQLCAEQPDVVSLIEAHHLNDVNCVEFQLSHPACQLSSSDTVV